MTAVSICSWAMWHNKCQSESHVVSFLQMTSFQVTHFSSSGQTEKKSMIAHDSPCHVFLTSLAIPQVLVFVRSTDVRWKKAAKSKSFTSKRSITSSVHAWEEAWKGRLKERHLQEVQPSIREVQKLTGPDSFWDVRCWFIRQLWFKKRITIIPALEANQDSRSTTSNCSWLLRAILFWVAPTQLMFMASRILLIKEMIAVPCHTHNCIQLFFDLLWFRLMALQEGSDGQTQRGQIHNQSDLPHRVWRDGSIWIV